MTDLAPDSRVCIQADMAHFHATRRLLYPARRMFELVLDIERYPEFVPGYRSARILRRDNNQLEVMQTVEFAGFGFEYRSLARFESRGSIHIASTDEPFDHFETDWRFAALAGGCRADCSVDWRFSNTAIAVLSEPLIADFTRRMLDAFMARARLLGSAEQDPGRA